MGLDETEASGVLCRKQHHLGAAKQGDRLPVGLIRYINVPDLRGAASMNRPGTPNYRAALTDGPDEVCLEFDRGEAGTFREVRAHAARAQPVSKRDDYGSPEKAGARYELVSDVEPAGHEFRFAGEHLDTYDAWMAVPRKLIQVRNAVDGHFNSDLLEVGSADVSCPRRQAANGRLPATRVGTKR